MPGGKAESDATSPNSNNANHLKPSVPSHHVENPGVLGPRFKNPWDTYEERSFNHVWKWHKEKRKSGIPMEGYLAGNLRPTAEDYRRTFPLNTVDWDALAAPPADGVQAVWVGHATVLVQMGGMTFITDPVLSERCAPVQFAGPKRLVPPAMTCREPQMPPLDFVLVSHNHYDHLDTDSVRTLNRRYGKALTWYVPLGLKPWFAGEGLRQNVVELDWWQSVQHTNPATGNSVTITMVPAQHWSARGVLDRFRTLWGGYVVTAPRPPPAAAAAATATAEAQPAQAAAAAANGGAAAPAASCPSAAWADPADAVAAAAGSNTSTAGGGADCGGNGAAARSGSSGSSGPLRFYFVGDTGYCSVFREIGERLGPIDLAAIPIGAYEPRWFMKPQHTNAEEGLQIALDVRAAVSIGIHTATWSLTDEPLDEPPTRLQAAVRERGLPPSSFVTLQHGEKAVVRGGQLQNRPKTLPVKDAAQ